VINKGEILINEPMKTLLARHGEGKLEQIYLGLIKQEGNALQL
jgi:ABC-type Na+ transport system ATPase subunit NatA